MGCEGSACWYRDQNLTSSEPQSSWSSKAWPPSKYSGYWSIKVEIHEVMGSTGHQTSSTLTLGFRSLIVVPTKSVSIANDAPILRMQRFRFLVAFVLLRVADAILHNRSPAPWRGRSWEQGGWPKKTVQQKSKNTPLPQTGV